MQPHDQTFLMHHGILGMHWGVRKAESFKKEAGKYQSKAAKARQDAANFRLQEKGLKARISSGKSSPTHTVKVLDKEGNLVTRQVHENSDLASLDAARSDRQTSEQFAALYQKRATLALKRAAGKKLTASDIAEKKAIFHEGMTMAGISVGTGVLLTAVTGIGGLPFYGYGAYKAIKTMHDNKEIKPE